MPSQNRILLIVALLTAWGISAFQGSRIEAIRDSEAFYRWTMSAANLTRLDETLEPDKSESVPEAMDEELFARLVELAEAELPDYEVDESEDVDAEGNPDSKLVRAVQQSHDDDIWKLVTSGKAAEIQSDFLKFMKSSQIQSLGTQFAAASLYDESTQAQGVGIANLFFGFRKVAANFLWIQVEQFWHQGQMHRMVPIMRTTVTLDPSFVDAYLLGAWHLAYNIPAKLEPTPEPLKKVVPYYHRPIGIREEWYLLGAEFLRDGIRKNPRDYRLYFDLGYGIYAQKLEDHPNAILYLDEARRQKHDRWVPRMLFRSLTENGQYEDAIEGWESYVEVFGESDVTRRKLIENHAYLSEAIADEARECIELARTAIEEWESELHSNPGADRAAQLQANIQDAESQIEELEARVQQELTKSYNIWTQLYETTGDTLALGQLTLRKAKELALQERYIEAIAELDVIRWQDLTIFEEASDLIIEIKEKGDLPLNISEQRQIIREEDTARLGRDSQRENRIYRIDCGFDHEQPSA